jgi:hypothetical protein
MFPAEYKNRHAHLPGIVEPHAKSGYDVVMVKADGTVKRQDDAVYHRLHGQPKPSGVATYMLQMLTAPCCCPMSNWT